MIYIKCFFLLKLSSLVTMLPMHDNNINGEITSPHSSHILITRSVTIPEKTTEQLSDGSRIDFQIRNHRGPGTYIFGFDTGHGKNRQYRIEERLRDGNVKGRYGFYDAKGKLRIINYVAGPSDGYQERHHETIAFTPET